MYYNFSSVHVNFQDMFHTYENRYASKCNFSALLFATKIMLLYYACQRSFVAFLCLARQIQARKTVLKQKSRSTTIKFWMYYNFNYVHVNFQDMFYTYEKRYVSKCNFPRFFLRPKLCCILLWHAKSAYSSFSFIHANFQDMSHT